MEVTGETAALHHCHHGVLVSIAAKDWLAGVLPDDGLIKSTVTSARPIGEMLPAFTSHGCGAS
jgi:hypothetical protein